MIEKYTEERTLKVDDYRFVCDLCEKKIEDFTTFIRVRVHKTHESGRMMSFDESWVDVCSTQCLQERSHVAGLLLNTKVIPDLDSHGQSGSEEKAEMTISSTRTGRLSSSQINLTPPPSPRTI